MDFERLSEQLEMENFFITRGQPQSEEGLPRFHSMRDIPLFLQNQKASSFEHADSIGDIWIKRIGSDSTSDQGHFAGQQIPNMTGDHLETWKMNLLAISEKHRLIVIAVHDKLHVYGLDPFSAEIIADQPPKIIDLINGGSDINNIRLVACADREFVVTVDFAAHVRMIYLDDLDKDPIKFTNEYPWA